MALRLPGSSKLFPAFLALAACAALACAPRAQGQVTPARSGPIPNPIGITYSGRPTLVTRDIGAFAGNTGVSLYYFSYDSEGRVDTVTHVYRSGLEQRTKLSYRGAYTYDAYGRLVHVNEENFDEERETWFDVGSYTLTFDAEGWLLGTRTSYIYSDSTYALEASIEYQEGRRAATVYPHGQDTEGYVEYFHEADGGVYHLSFRNIDAVRHAEDRRFCLGVSLRETLQVMAAQRWGWTEPGHFDDCTSFSPVSFPAWTAPEDWRPSFRREVTYDEAGLPLEMAYGGWSEPEGRWVVNSRGRYVNAGGRHERYTNEVWDGEAGAWKEVNWYTFSYAGERPPAASEPIPENRLLGNAPNPASGYTYIQYVVAEAGPVRMRVFDMLGRQVATLIDRDLPAQASHVYFDTSSLPSGVYVYTLETAGSVTSRTLVHVAATGGPPQY